MLEEGLVRAPSGAGEATGDGLAKAGDGAGSGVGLGADEG